MRSKKRKTDHSSHKKGLPESQRDWSLYRARLACKIGRDALEGKRVPAVCSAMEYAVFNLLHAVEEIAEAMEHNAPLERSTVADTLRGVVGKSVGVH